uniref:Glycosyl transferase 64 domain-containing protein n=1 Tax=Dunaliella tertiolecta TaxID=3047 RepID=A0A7S3QRE9_DUNTE|mmetsp:Transcript_9014/g.24266  ORF Transcript_9014/g.24266 Transcript_9014/m.24266 type:complete len:973 (-) Transcript_9014:166-3084(-)
MNDRKSKNLCFQPLFLSFIVLISLLNVSYLFTAHNSTSHREERAHSVYRVTISVITFNRPAALSRLLASLSRASYGNDRVDLILNIEAGAPEETFVVAESFTWPRGIKSVRARVSPSGLVPAVVESWFPSDPREFGLILEDDIEVSPQFYVWLQKAFLHLRASNLHERVFGISLYTPRVIETTNPYRHYRPDKELSSYSALAYMHQLPCSWGAVQFPKPWALFHRYMFHRMSVNNSFMTVPGSATNGWKQSWKKFYIELAWAKGMFMLYPNFFNQSSFSTNHLEAGVHISKADATHTPENYTVPLNNQELQDQLWENTLPILDVFNQEYNQNAHFLMTPKAVPCARNFNGYTGTRFNSTHSPRERVGNKLETGFQLVEGSSLVSIPQRSGEFQGHYFVGSMQNGLFNVSMYRVPSSFVRNIYNFGYSMQGLPWTFSLQLTDTALIIVSTGCNPKDDSVLCKPVWQLPLNKSSQHTLHLQSDGNLVIKVACGCSNDVVWQSLTSVPGFLASPITCYGGRDHSDLALVPGSALKSSVLNTLKSRRDAHGRYAEAVMQSDGNFVVYTNPSDPPKPISNIVAMPPKSAFEYRFSFTIALNGQLIIRAAKAGRSSVVWQSGFNGLQGIPHFLVLGLDGSLNVYEGYSLCEIGSKVWSSKTNDDIVTDCPTAQAEQTALLCGQESQDVYQFFSDPETLTVMVSTIGSGERASLLERLIVYLSEVPFVSCILVVWHKPYQPCPQSSIMNGKLVKYLLTSTDSLNNRFYPSVHVTTEAVLVLDDDIVVHKEDIHLLFSTWKLFKDKIAGFFPRWYQSSGGLDKYLFQSENHDPAGYPIMLTKAMMLHKKYLYEYSCGRGRLFHAIVDIQTNCEDLAMNFLVANISGGPSSIYVKPFHLIGDYGKSMPGSLQKRDSHQGVRTDCLREFEGMLKIRLSGQVKSAYGTHSGTSFQLKLNSTYIGVDRHHVDCSQSLRTEGCWL